MKQSERKKKSLPAAPAGGENSPSLAELRALRAAHRESAQRVEELKVRLFRITEQHMDQAVRLIRRWLSEAGK